MMVPCISIDRKYHDIGAITARFVARGSEHTILLMRE